MSNALHSGRNVQLLQSRRSRFVLSPFLPSSEVRRWEPDRETEEGMELQGTKGKRLLPNETELRAIYYILIFLIHFAGWHDGLMISALASGSSGPGLNPCQGSLRGSSHPGVTGE